MELETKPKQLEKAPSDRFQISRNHENDKQLWKDTVLSVVGQMTKDYSYSNTAANEAVLVADIIVQKLRIRTNRNPMTGISND